MTSVWRHTAPSASQKTQIHTVLGQATVPKREWWERRLFLIEQNNRVKDELIYFSNEGVRESGEETEQCVCVVKVNVKRER